MLRSPHWPVDFLDRYLKFTARQLEELIAAGRHIFDVEVQRISSPEKLQATARFLSLTKISMARVTSTTGVDVIIPEPTTLRVQIPIAGRAITTLAGKDYPVDTHNGCIVPDHPFADTLADEYQDRLTIRIAPEVIERQLTGLLGARPKSPVRFTPQIRLDGPHFWPLLHLTNLLGNSLGSQAMPRLFAEQLEDSIISALIFASDHNYRELLEREPKAASRPELLRIEEYLEANFSRTVSVEELASVSGVSARTLFKTFRHYRGYSPMSFVRTVRLKKARDMLSAPNGATSVTGVAVQCGFANAGHFARYYRETFGEHPSDTLRRGRLG